jgi:hypothetical protein
MPLNFDSEVDFVDQDVRYMDQLEALEPNRFSNWRDWCNTNLISAINSYTIPEGKVVMPGVWNGNIYSLLQAEYGSERCVGFDIVSYYTETHNSVVYGDFREIHTNNAHSIAVLYNGLGTWENNTTSKQAGLTYALANLVSGGIYLEPRTDLAVQTLQAEDGLEYLECYGDRLIICRKP